MDRSLYPVDLLDRPGVANLPAEHKLVTVATAVHPRLSCCAVLTVTPYVARSLPLPADVWSGLLADLDRRGIVIYDPPTAEVYLVDSFTWHRVPAADDDDPWARQVRAALRQVKSPRIRLVIEAELARPPLVRSTAVMISSNLLTALPARGAGCGWSATEMLVAFVLAASPEQNPAGVCRPMSLAGLAELASVPLETLLETVRSLSALKAAAYDPDTGELFSAARLRCAARRDHRRINDEAQLIDSRLIFNVFSGWCKRLKIKIDENQWFGSQVMGGNVIKEEVIIDRATAKKFGLRHGPFVEAGGCNATA